MRIGIDIGGSHIGLGLVEGNEIISVKDKIITDEDKKDIENILMSEIHKMIFEILTENKLEIGNIVLIGISCPGTISNGIITKAGNLNLKNFDLVGKLKNKYDIPIQIRNDGKCAALAEKAYGVLKEYEDCVFSNIGTGIGGAVFMNGKLLEPKRYSGFEFGHMTIKENGKDCSCGKKGCFEAYSSIKSLKKRVVEALNIEGDVSGQYLREELLPKDNDKVKEIIEEFLESLKTGICNLIDIFEPEAICFGGSFSYYEGNPIFDRLIEKINSKNTTFNEGEKPKILTARFKNDAGIIGSTILE